MPRIFYKFPKRSLLIILIILIILILLFRLLNVTAEDSESEGPRLRQFEVSRLPARRHLNISIGIVVQNLSEAEKEYQTALTSIRCYSRRHGYPLVLVEDSQYAKYCKQKDFMFRRHCVVAKLLEETEWMLFLDADVAVVNPNTLIEEYINPIFDITFYDRFVNFEVAAGSYLVKNTQWSKDFLMRFANFESQLPKFSFHGTDNGAIHLFLQQVFYPELNEDALLCRSIWEQSNGFYDLYTFEACMRTIMGASHEFPKVRILKKGTGWMRDIWITDSKWSPERDFMLHGLKESNKISFQQGFIVNTIFSNQNWRTPFLPDIQRCQWNMNENLMTSKLNIEKLLRIQFEQVERFKWEILSAIAKFL